MFAACMIYYQMEDSAIDIIFTSFFENELLILMENICLVIYLFVVTVYAIILTLDIESKFKQFQCFLIVKFSEFKIKTLNSAKSIIVGLPILIIFFLLPTSSPISECAGCYINPNNNIIWFYDDKKLNHFLELASWLEFNRIEGSGVTIGKRFVYPLNDYGIGLVDNLIEISYWMETHDMPLKLSFSYNDPMNKFMRLNDHFNHDNHKASFEDIRNLLHTERRRLITFKKKGTGKWLL